MSEQARRLPDVAIRSIGSGLLLMGFFTMVWTGIAQAGLQGRDHRVVLVVFSVISLIFFFFGVRIFRSSKDFPPITSEEDLAENKRMSRNFGIIFGVEGLTIPLVCGLLSGFGYERFMFCGIAMVVGLHFYPMAKIFGRTIDYYLASWACITTLIVAALLWYNRISDQNATAILGIAMAMTTSSYGIFMMRNAKRFM